ncbi:PHD finger protein 3 [Nerophis lumbriciformis]|uniref:PHD finger protein 3 n=1 Tax=Nerophis lumbriciformis TaxID=546530 RepID=UPI002AE030E2|nr:PHD finger protein 3-like [Nerophis lumbriciformis]
MDIVDAFNLLIPSDQLDDTLIVGQNLECEASNEFGPGLCLEDSLKNMLSDKDPMFGCASSQFNLLDSEDPTFQIPGATDLGSGSTSDLGGELAVTTETNPVRRAVGRPRRRPCNVELDTESAPTGPLENKPLNRQQKSFLIDEGVKGVQLKKELTLGGRININHLEGGLWLKPSVVLKRLTVTIGGFKIELLPGPSYLHDADANFDSSFSYGGDIGFTMLSEDAVSVSNSEKVPHLDVAKKKRVDDTPLGLGPYVNPNDVQAANGMESKISFPQESGVDNQNVVRKQKPDKDGVKSPPDNGAASNTVDVKERKGITAKNLLQSKQPLNSNKNKGLIPCEQSSMAKGANISQSIPSTVVQRDDLPKSKCIKLKRSSESLKRPGENTPSEHASKLQKIHTGEHKVKPISPVKKTPSSGYHSVEQHSPTKPSHAQNSSHAARPGHSLKTPEEAVQEKPKAKKLEKILQRQKSKTSRSISVDEPQLFVPDNAPAVKRESIEEQPANSESVWDGNNCCGLCKKHHNNMFMVGCGRCDDWFHGDCVGLDLPKVREMEEEDEMYVCLKCCEEESKKVEPDRPTGPVPEIRTGAPDHKQTANPKPGSSQALTSGSVRSVKKEPGRRSSTEPSHKTGFPLKLEAKVKSASSTSKRRASVEEIRRSVRDSLKEILIQRLKDSDLNIPVEKALEVAKKTERELFHMYKDTENKYKNKYRSLMFNLKDTKNNVLFKKVLKGEISPANLIRMSPEELASKELAAWRQRENRHTIEMIEKEQREVERRPITKITHKGEIEIESEEPVKAPEPVKEVDSPVRVSEAPVEPSSAPENVVESAEEDKDTTKQHKAHLFDLNCKICTGRMAPPVKEAPTKVVKVATTVAKRQSAKGDEACTAPPAVEDDLHLSVLEESFQKAQTSYERRSDPTSGGDDDTSFLSTLTSLWRGFITMHSVAKLVTKAFPVSGNLDNLTQDFPDSIQVGGRISPQTVWDYLEKIRATGTKEVCLIRFSPVTEEDEISYTLLYAYFSSRRRFGVVSNNRKQVKDMYIIPLGATEKVPHQLVPFDGPGLENNRANLLLGLIIRQRPKRDYLPVVLNEAARMSPEVKAVPVSVKEAPAEEEDEKLFLAALTTPNKSEQEKLLETAEAREEPITECFEEAAPSGKNNPESQKPLRFLPGVLVGWGGELPPLPDFGETPKTEALTSPSSKSPTAAAPRERFVIKKKEVKPVQAEPASPCQTEAANASSGKAAEAAPRSAPVTLRDKPPDVSTDAFLESLSATTQSREEVSSSPNPEDAALFADADNMKPESQAASDHTHNSKAPLSGILKKISAYSSATENKASESSSNAPVETKPAPVLCGAKNSPVTTFHQGLLQMSQAKQKLKEQNQSEDPAEVTSPSTLPACISAAAVAQQQPVPNSFHNPHVQDQDQNQATDEAPQEEQRYTYCHPWEMPRHSEERDEGEEEDEEEGEEDDQHHHQHHRGGSRHRRDSHHGKKSKHHSRERERKHERNHDDKQRERSRHHAHAEDRFGEKRKERYHSDDYSSRHKERHRHRRDSDYENGRRGSKDSNYS